ncbi:heterokaryon incompatibility protein-domain-containing protein [Pestalotiopsis sp. NC0098]|nr:heterokaryon incompatibility protein-domain-containing protein [Pestalotiopsis sp. NC0098]
MRYWSQDNTIFRSADVVTNMSQLRPAWPAEQTGGPPSAFAEPSTISLDYCDNDDCDSDDCGNDDCSTYKHQPLDAVSFRILRLLPADKLDDTLECEIQHVPLPKSGIQNISYMALSYVWGKDHTSSCKMIVQDGHIMIRPNLDSALRHLRRRNAIITLWVDALCIDQSNVQERNHQVQHMRQIYETAEETIVYLGPQDGGNTGLSAWNYLERNSSWVFNEKGEKDSDAPTKLNNLTAFRGDIHDICNDILPREWFRRLWVLQEFVVSKRVSLQCGNRRVPGDTLFRLILCEPRNIDIYGRWAHEDELVEPISHIWTTRVAFHIAKNQQQYLPSWCKDASETVTTNLLDTLVRTRSLIASDPRDKIFGLLGISSGFDWQSNDTIDYNVTTRELYTKFAHDFLRTKHGFRILSYREGKPIQMRINEVGRIFVGVLGRLQELKTELNRLLNMNPPPYRAYVLQEEEIELQRMVKAADHEAHSLLLEYATRDKPLQRWLRCILQHDHRTPMTVPNTDDGSNDFRTPSWVPTWRHRSSNIHEDRPIIEVLHSKGAIPTRYRPSGVEAFLLKPEDKFQDILRVHGKVIGVISTSISPCEFSSSQEGRFMGHRTEMQRNSQSGKLTLEANILSNLADMLDENAILEVDPKGSNKHMFQPVGVRNLTGLREFSPFCFIDQFRRKISIHSDLGLTFKNYFNCNSGPSLTGSIEHQLLEHISDLFPQSMSESSSRSRQAETRKSKRHIFQNRVIGLYRPSPLNGREVHIPPSYSDELRQSTGISDDSELLETDRRQSEEGGKGSEDTGHEQVLEWTPGSPRGLALLPLEAQFGDLIVYFPSAQVPFLVRRLENASTEALDYQDSTAGLRFADDIEYHVQCELVGECWINDFPQIEQEMGKLDCLFHIS